MASIHPVKETAERLHAELMARGDVDCVVALTHQVFSFLCVVFMI